MCGWGTFVYIYSEEDRIECGMIKDSGEQQSFATGAVRDTAAGKPRYDKIPIKFLRALGEYFKDHDLPENCRLDLISIPFLIRFGCHYGNGAKKYAERNWEQGMPRERFKESAWRHFIDLMDNMTDEDHASAVAFNVAGPVHFDELGKSDLIDPPSKPYKHVPNPHPSINVDDDIEGLL